jgi:hypothetical protein
MAARRTAGPRGRSRRRARAGPDPGVVEVGGPVPAAEQDQLAGGRVVGHRRAVPRRRAGSTRRIDPQPVAIRIAKFHFAPVRLLPDRLTELGHDGVEVTDCQVNQGVWPRIALVFGEIQLRPATGDRHERGASWLEAVLPLLGEPQALIPPDRCRRVSDAQNRDDSIIHSDMVSRSDALGVSAAVCAAPARLGPAPPSPRPPRHRRHGRRSQTGHRARARLLSPSPRAP